MKRILIILIALTIVIAGGVYYWQTQNKPATTTTARTQTATVQRGSLVATVSAAGNVTAPKQVALAFQTSGRVTKVNVQVGDRVQKDQLLMELDATDLQYAFRNAQISLSTAQMNYANAKIENALNPNKLLTARAGLDKARVTLEQAQGEYNRIAWRPDVGMTSQAATLQQATIDYQVALANYNTNAATINDAALKSAEASLENSKIALEQAQRNLDKTKITAPYAGLVSVVNFNVGDTAGTGAAVTIVDLSKLEVKVTVAEVDIAKIKSGATAQMTLDALTGKTYAAQVSAVGPIGTVTQGVVNYPVVLTITNADDAIKPGMTCNLSIIVESRENVLIVPTRAVRSQGNQRIVTVMSGDKPTSVPVRTGLSSDSSIEIVSGLNEGDVIVISQTTTTSQSGGGQPGGIGIPFLGR
ncbi:MAG: efflux RND transporter periplasmic adaptor subunit [Chloroflexi bacterium]|nr:efflux RND transporter periplasmic adaptor subunit [Chloroflexota bacterium]